MSKSTESTRADAAARLMAQRCAAALFGALALGPFACHAQGRMDPVERERLRHDVREQAREDRHRLREHRPVRDDTQAGSRDRPDSPAQRPPPRTPDGPGWPGAAPRPPHPSGGDDGRRRLSPEERDALRMQLRERRRERD